MKAGQAQVMVAAIVSIAVAAIMFSPFMNLWHLSTAVHTGDGREQAWALAWVSHALTTGTPLFDSNMFFPERGSLVHEDHLIALTVLATPFWLATRNAVLTFNVLQLLGPATSSLAVFLLARSWTRDWVAALVGGLAFGMSFFMLLHNAHLNLTWALGLPLCVWFLDRWWDRPTWTNLACVWMAALFGALTSAYMAVVVAVLLAVHATVMAIVARHFALAIRARQVAVGIALGAVILVPLVRPYLAFASGEGEAAAYGADVYSYIVPPENTVLGHWLVDRGLVRAQSIWGERTLYAGWTLIALSAAGLFASLRSPERIQRRHAWVLLSVVAVGIALSFGSAENRLAPFDLLARLPGFAGFRATARFALLASLGMAVLAAFGLAKLRSTFPRAGTMVTIVLAVLMLSEWFVVNFPAGHPVPEPMPEVYSLARGDGARSAIALPIYANQPDWFKEGDYLLYSTSADFLPLVNGVGRWVPRTYSDLGEAMRDFPSPASASALRSQGVTHVILHSARFGADAPALLERVRQATDYAVVEQRGADVLLRVTSS